jgi:hypothetical protein
VEFKGFTAGGGANADGKDKKALLTDSTRDNRDKHAKEIQRKRVFLKDEAMRLVGTVFPGKKVVNKENQDKIESSLGNKDLSELSEEDSKYLEILSEIKWDRSQLGFLNKCIRMPEEEKVGGVAKITKSAVGKTAKSASSWILNQQEKQAEILHADSLNNTNSNSNNSTTNTSNVNSTSANSPSTHNPPHNNTNANSSPNSTPDLYSSFFVPRYKNISKDVLRIPRPHPDFGYHAQQRKTKAGAPRGNVRTQKSAGGGKKTTREKMLIKNQPKRVNKPKQEQLRQQVWTGTPVICRSISSWAISNI